MREQPLFASIYSPALAQTLNSPEITERLANLFGQHAALTEVLRELYQEVKNQSKKPIEWHDLESQVINLRGEVEALKQIFPLTECSENAFSDKDLLEF